MRHLRLVVHCALLSACGGTVPPAKSRPVEAHYGADRFIAARGYAKGDLAAAARAARAEVSRMLRSQIRSTAVVDERAGPDGEEMRSAYRIEERARFENSELIKVDDRLSRCVGDRCEAVAFMERAEAARVLGAAYTPLSAEFRRDAAAAQTAADPVAFTAAYRRAQLAYEELESRGYELEVVGAQPVAEFDTDKKKMAALETARAEHAQALSLTVLPPEVHDATFSGPVRDALVASLTGMGLPAAAGEACEDGYGLASVGLVRCGRGSLGPRCDLQLELELIRCPDQTVAAPVLAGAKLRGVSPRDKASARRQLIDRVEASRIGPALRAALAPFLPIQ